MNNALGIGYLVRDIDSSKLRERLSLLKSLTDFYQIQAYVFDNSINNDYSWVGIEFPNIVYHKHDKDLSYDESYRYAIENIKEEYIWVLGEKTSLSCGSIPFILDYIIRNKVSAIIVGCNGRLGLCGAPYIENDTTRFVRTVAWHTTLCGSIIFNKYTVKFADKYKYMGHGFIHTAILLDGITKNLLKGILIIPYSFLNMEYPKEPAWLPRMFEVWCRDLGDMLYKLPYKEIDVLEFMKHNGYCGALLYEQNLRTLAYNGIYNEEIFNKYKKRIMDSCIMPEELLLQIAREGNEYVREVC